jgi:hypothetical protein
VPALKVLSDAMVLMFENDTFMNRTVRVPEHASEALKLIDDSPYDTFMNCIKTLWNVFSGRVKHKDVLWAEQIRADVEETEAILNGYWEGLGGNSTGACGAAEGSGASSGSRRTSGAGEEEEQ